MPTISISTREDENNRSMIQPPACTESGLTLRPISLGSLEVLRQLGNPLSAGNAHPLAYMAAAMRNLYTLINHHIGQAPNVELVKRGHKTLLIPEGTPESQLGILINKFTRG